MPAIFGSGEHRYNVPEGVIRDRVIWFAVIYRFDGEEVLVAKPAPAPGALSLTGSALRLSAWPPVQSFSA